jgi:RIO kinase 2
MGRSTNFDAIVRASGQQRERIKFALNELNLRKLVGISGENYILYAPALDMLALKHYADRDYAISLGKLIAKGKESDVYEVLSAQSQLYALKLFRLGRTSFRDVQRKRSSAKFEANTWISSNYRAARQEFIALNKLADVTKNVPRVVDSDRHTVLLEELPGVRLSNRPELDDPSATLATILSTMRAARVKARMINGDLSEYNVLTDGVRAWLIDWPQWVPPTHPNADELLRHDVETILRFFSRAYGVESDLEKELLHVQGKRRPPIRRGRSSGPGSGPLPS